MKLAKALCGVAALAMVATPLAARAAETAAEKTARLAEEKKLGSFYLRCDGQPNNMPGMETFGRLVALSLVVGLLLPQPEEADASKRLFGDKGVDACNRLIDGEKGVREENGLRRVPLMLARGLHRIEAKDYKGALADVELARSEAKGLGLIGNPYFDRSMGLSFDNIEAEARLRLGDPQGAEDASLRLVSGIHYSLVPIYFARDHGQFQKSFSPAAERRLADESRLLPAFLISYAARLDEMGRFADSAARHEALVGLLESLKPEHKDTDEYARAALSHALAGNWDKAIARADEARANLRQRNADGVPEDNASTIVEILDLFDIVRMAHDGNVAGARRSFSARSEWLSSSFGAVQEVNRRLRAGAAAQDLIGALGKSPEERWAERRDNALAVRLQKDTDNKTLFGLITPYARVGEFEGRSKEVWRTDKSRYLGAKPNEKNGRWGMVTFSGYQTAYDSLVLHAALMAKAKGKKGFSIFILLPKGETYISASVKFMNPGEDGLDDALYLDADAVIADLRQLIPSPAELEARRQTAKKKA